jgi:aldose 1-epimerase
MPWDIQDHDSNRVVMSVKLDAETYRPRGYPFSLNITVTYGLNANGLSCAFKVENIGDRTAPVGIGFHPYFTVGAAKMDEAEVRIPGTGYLEFNERLVPTGTICSVTDTAWDYRRFRPIARQRFNHCYVNLERDAEGIATAALRHIASNRTITITMDSAFSAVVVYTGDAIADAPRAALAIEPMTCASDAFNHPEWGLKRLLPGETFSGCWGVDDSRRQG